MESHEWFSLQELTDRLGALVWVESQLSEVLGLWSGIEQNPSAAVLFATASGHHHWHSEIVRNCLPTSPALGASESVRPPTAGWQRAIPTLASIVDPQATATRLKALVKLVDPWLDREVGALNELGRPVSDAALTRWLRFVALDHHDNSNAASQLLAQRSSDAVRFDEHILLNDIDLGES